MIDIGANLAHKSFRSDLAEVLARAWRVGVEQIIVTGVGPQESQSAADIANAEPRRLFSTAGVHPHNASRFDEGTSALLAGLAAKPQVVTIGECGLDYNRDFSPRDVQRRVFEAHLELAAELRLPVFLHERDAHEDFLALLTKWRPRLVGGVVHCFTGSGAALEAYLELDLHIGITGWICDERRGAHLVSLVPKIPPDRLLAETDAPFLLPRDLRPKPKSRRNEPVHLPHVVAALARAAQRPEQQLALETTRNARRLFALPQPAEKG